MHEAMSSYYVVYLASQVSTVKHRQVSYNINGLIWSFKVIINNYGCFLHSYNKP